MKQQENQRVIQAIIAKMKQSNQLNRQLAPVFKEEKNTHDVHNEKDTDSNFGMQVFK